MNSYKVTSADFYFYDEQGNFVLKANVWDGGAPEGTPGNNIEYIGDKVVVLEGLSGKNYPSWVVTILNQPAGFQPGATLDEMGKLLFRNGYQDGVLTDPAYLNENHNFIMTTSSYFGDTNKTSNGWNYFATKLNPNNFYQETPDKVDFTNTDRVQIYVERLAVRVGVDVKISNGTQEIKRIGDRLLYRVDASVSGNDNDDVSNGNQTGAGATKLYVEITGWNLTSTAMSTKVMKDLTGWSDNTTFGGTNWAWNIKNNRRSYWGQSTTYGLEGDALTAQLESKMSYENLIYKTTDVIFTGDRAYCNENTNLPQNITDNGLVTGKIDPTKTTTVLLQAVVCDENGNPVELVNFQGVNYLKNSFLAKALLNTQSIYVREQVGVATDEAQTPVYKYTTIDEKYLKLVSAGQGTGTVEVVVADNDIEYFTINPNLPTEEIQYEKKDEEGNVIETGTITSYNATKVNPNTLLSEFTRNNKAIAYTDGASFYPIAIEHLNNPVEKEDGTTASEIIEAQYGVVRNHIYNIRISKIKTLGHGVFVPHTLEDGTTAEPITPESKDPTYYVESKVNILSWKIVSQEEEI